MELAMAMAMKLGLESSRPMEMMLGLELGLQRTHIRME